MRIPPGSLRALRVPKQPLRRTAVLPGRRPAWRPPVNLIGLLERIGSIRLAPA